jgi:hypothetical protein
VTQSKNGQSLVSAATQDVARGTGQSKKTLKKHVEQKWKAALIAVFNDEITLTAQMGDWLHMQNHQESEWWLSVQDKCIYRQNCGEW